MGRSTIGWAATPRGSGWMEALSLQYCPIRWRVAAEALPSTRYAPGYDLVEMEADDAAIWWSRLPDHIAMVYFDKEHQQVTQIPILLRLLEFMGFPGLPDLKDDLLNGFEVLGELHPGCGWNPRLDDKYSFPVDMQTFKKLNHHYVKEKLRKSHIDPHWQVMLDELIQERDKGRVSGPFEAPKWWRIQAQAIPDTPLEQLPTEDMSVASFVSPSPTRRGGVRTCGDRATIPRSR